MARIISASINLSKIDKSKIVKGKNGQYYNLSIIVNDEANEYGQDVAIVQEQSKEERENKVSKVYLGNGKTVWQSGNDQASSGANQSNQSSTGGEEDLPF